MRGRDGDGSVSIECFILFVEEPERVPRGGEREFHEDVEVGVSAACGVGEHRGVVHGARPRPRRHLDLVAVVVEIAVFVGAEHASALCSQRPRVVVQLRHVHVGGPAGDVADDAIVAQAGEDAGLVRDGPRSLGRIERHLLQRVRWLVLRVDVPHPKHPASVRRGVQLLRYLKPAADDGHGLHGTRRVSPPSSYWWVWCRHLTVVVLSKSFTSSLRWARRPRGEG